MKQEGKTEEEQLQWLRENSDKKTQAFFNLRGDDGLMTLEFDENGKVILPEIPEVDENGEPVLDENGKPKWRKL